MAGAQETLDYLADAQYRVAADTLALQSSVSVTTSAAGWVDLPADVILIDDVLEAGQILPRYDLVNFLRGISGNAAWSVRGFALIGRRLYVVPAAEATFTLTYRRRPVGIASGDEMELHAEYDELAKRLLEASAFYDRAEPEMAMHLIDEYRADAARLRSLSIAGYSPQPTRFRIGRAV